MGACLLLKRTWANACDGMSDHCAQDWDKYMTTGRTENDRYCGMCWHPPPSDATSFRGMRPPVSLLTLKTCLLSEWRAWTNSFRESWIHLSRCVLVFAPLIHATIELPPQSGELFNNTTLSSLESYVTMLTLRTSPRILHLPVVCASLTSVTYGQNTMVETRTAWSGEHARGVQLKRVLVCLNGDGHRLLCHCRHHCLLAVGRHVRETDDSSLRNAKLQVLSVADDRSAR